MRGIHRLCVFGRMQIFCLLILFMALQSLATSIKLSKGGNELDSILKLNPLPADTFNFPETENQLIFNLSSYYQTPANVANITFIHTGTDPDKYPILRHIGTEISYDFFRKKNLFFTRVIFESNNATTYNFQQENGDADTRYFNSCIFRNIKGNPLFRFAGGISTNITFENCLFYGNGCVARFEFWSGTPVIKFTHCTFGNNDTIFTFSPNFNKNWIRFTNSIFSNNKNIVPNYDLTDRMEGSITRNDSLFIDIGDRTEPSHWKLADNSKAKAIGDTTGVPLRDISSTIRGSLNGKYDAGCWALLRGGAPSISKQPEDTTVAEGTDAVFEVEANGSEPLRYQWYKNGDTIPGATSSELKLSKVTASADEDTIAEYYCVITNNIGEDTSRVCTLTIVKKPKFTDHPKDSTVIEGNNVSFSASALRAYRYYWIMGDDSISEGSTLVLESVTQELDGSQYRCVAVNIAGSDTSNPAKLTVNGKAPKIVKQPETVAALKNDKAVFYLNASGSSLKYTWYKIGDPDIDMGIDNDSLVIEDVTEKGFYFCVVGNEFGKDTSDTVELVIIESTNLNPLFIKQVRMIDRNHVLISLQRFDVLPVVSGEQPYVDSIGIWYEEGGFPKTPIRNVPNFVKISMNEILGSGSSTFEKIIEVNRRDCITYYFAASPFWKNPDTIPSFDTANGASAFMCSTAPLSNPLHFVKTEYKIQLGTIDVEIAGFNTLEDKKDSLEYVLVWYSSTGQEVVKCDTLKTDTLENIWSSSGVWSKRYEDDLFSGPEEVITFNVSWRGILGNYSDTVKETQSVGTPRTVNYCTLTVDSVRSTSVKLRWSKEQGDNIEKVKIWYGSKEIPVNREFDTTEYVSVIADADLKEVLIDNLSENTLYHFGLQTYISGQYWSFVTEKSSTSAKTMNPGDLPNTITIIDISFDSLTNRITINWDIDTIGISGSKLKTGFWWDITDEKGNPSKGFKRIDSTLSRPDVIYIDVDQHFFVDTTYHFALWMGYEGKDGVYRWAEPENCAKRTLRIPQPGWQKITYFKSKTDSVALFNHKIVLKPGDNWSDAIYEDTLKVFRPDLSRLKPGLIPVSMGVDFYRHHPSNEIYMSLTCDSLPKGYSIKDVFMYQYDELTDSISVLPRISFDESGRTVTSSFKPHLKRFPFILMIDTQEPVVKILSDTASVISAKTSVIDWTEVSDNIINSKVKLFIYRNDDSLFEVSSETASWHKDTIITTIDSNYVSQNHSVFAWLFITDERNTKWINISRQVFKDFNNATITKDQWNPVFSHSVLDSPSAPVALGKISSEPQWKYDNVHFRIFTWDKPEENKYNTWVEYSEEKKDLFSFAPGRIFWVKTRETKSVNLGKGVTFPLKNTFSDIVLSAQSFTDFALPVHFNVVIQDILDSTSMDQEDITESLGFYKWARNGNGLYQTEILYQSNLVQYNNSGVVLKPDSCYSVYNSFSTDIRLRIPLITEKMSTRKESGESGSLEKSGFTERWNITIRARTDEELISPVYCGFSPGKGSHCFPVSPSFSKVRAGVLDSDNNRVHGIMVAHEKSDNGISFPLVFDNSDSKSNNVQFELENWGSMPANYKVCIFNPDIATYENRNNGFSIGAGQREYRFLIAGDDNYIANWKSNFTKFSFSLLKVYPNPFRGKIQIRFMLPYSGVSRIRLTVYDQLGRRLCRKDMDKNLHPGENIIVWDANTGGRLAAGTYILQLTALDGSGKVKGVKRERIMYMP